MTGLTAALAEFIHVKTLDDLPPEALDKAKKAIADTFAVMLAGAGSEVAPPLLRYVEQLGERVAYLSPADNSHGSLLGRLKGAHQAVIKPRNRFSASCSSLLAGLETDRCCSTARSSS